jgi:hypothetical protein
MKWKFGPYDELKWMKHGNIYKTELLYTNLYLEPK